MFTVINETLINQSIKNTRTHTIEETINNISSIDQSIQFNQSINININQLIDNISGYYYYYY